MKILMIVLLFLIAMMMGCSNSHNRSFSLWEDRQMDDDQRIYGSPYGNSYESPDHWQSVWLPTPF
jgi:Na+-transporting methylmalonyl-CoA/oxaloacetate decarboxylase gamma subunit